MTAFSIQEAAEPDTPVIRALFREYADWLAIDLCFQNFDHELATLPGPYARPRGFLLLAKTQDEVAGCIALKPLEEHICEMKRLYVKPEFRGHGLGQLLAERCIQEAKLIGYSLMRLDTLGRMQPALALYRKLGFRECDPYYENPQPDVVYLELKLTRSILGAKRYADFSDLVGVWGPDPEFDARIEEQRQVDPRDWE